MAKRLGSTFFTFQPVCDGKETCRCQFLCKKRKCMAATNHSEILAAHRFAKKEKDKKDSQRIREFTDANLKAPDGKTFCVECQTVFWACSRNKLYPPAPTAVEQRPRTSQWPLQVVWGQTSPLE